MSAAVIDTIRKSGVKRALFVVGAGSLLRKDGKRHYDFMAEKGVQPPTSLPALQAYEEIQKIDDLDWTAISPPASIPAGQRTGKFRLGLDKLIMNAKGESRISREDFAIAIVDEIEKSKHVRKRFHGGLLRRDGNFRNLRSRISEQAFDQKLRHPDRSRAQRGVVEGPVLLSRRHEEVPRLRRPLGRLRSG